MNYDDWKADIHNEAGSAPDDSVEPRCCDNSDEYGCPELRETGENCAACQAHHDYWHRIYRAEWAVASPAERDPEGYRRDMIDGGRGHLLREDDR
jgi:hypothetical protein